MVDDRNCSVLYTAVRNHEHIPDLQSELGPAVLGSGFQFCVCMFLLTNVDIFFYDWFYVFFGYYKFGY